MSTKTTTKPVSTNDVVEKLSGLVEEAGKRYSTFAEESAQKLHELLEQAAETRKSMTLTLIDSYEDASNKAVEAYEKAVADSRVDWLKDAVTPQAALARELTAAYVATARQLVN